MFKLESYITPIILNYVAKYVKNIRPQDAQVSLWQGEVAFQNLDLRLDVLEQELNLPFEFLSGHIHEMIILVPWTKINSEPMNVTINTIEFVLKLKEQHDKENSGVPSSQSTPQKKKERKKRVSKIEESQQGYAPGLVSKVINNATITCNNIILKYVEDDIVVSMNVQLLSLRSVDKDWNSAFVEMNPMNKLLRKVVEISDLTICLDKRNSMGQIEVCQEPILYKCSLLIRLVFKSFNGIHLTRVGIKTKQVEMNISSLQFPMALRLFNLMLSLKSGELNLEGEDEELDTQSEEYNSQLPPTWADTVWNLLPWFSFSEFDDEDEDQRMRIDENIRSILDFGFYIENLKFTLKFSEFVNDSIVGSQKKIRYTPIITVILQEIYSETVIDETTDWLSSKSGIGKVTTDLLGNFFDEKSEKYILHSSKEIKGDYLLDSLFDENSDNELIITNAQDYYTKNTEGYLQSRAPFFNFSMIKYKKFLKDNDGEKKFYNETNFDINLSSVSFRYNTVVEKLIDTINEWTATYDYPPYKTIVNEEKIGPPVVEDYDSLMSFIPMKNMKFSFNDINVKIYPKDEVYVYSDHKIKTIQKLSNSFRGKLPHFSLTIHSCNGKFISPEDPDLLIRTTSQLPKPPVELVNACYENFIINFGKITLSLCDNNSENQMLNIAISKIHFGKLINPHLWKKHNFPKIKSSFHIEEINIKFTKPRLILITYLTKAIIASDLIETINLVETSARVDNLKENIIALENAFNGINAEAIIYTDMVIACQGYLKSFRSDFLIRGGFSKICLLESIDIHQKNITNWIDWTCQISCTNGVSCQLPSLCYFSIRNYSIFINLYLIEFLNYKEYKILSGYNESLLSDNNIALDRRVSSDKNLERSTVKRSIASSSRKISYPEETIHMSSEKDYKEKHKNILSDKKSNDFNLQYRTMLSIMKYSIVHIIVNQGGIYFNNLGEFSREYETYTIWVPKLVCKSTSSEHFDLSKNFPIDRNTWWKRESFPWTCNITSFSINYKTDEGMIYPILHPINTSITIALDHKLEKISVGKSELIKIVEQIQEKDKKEKKQKKKKFFGDSNKPTNEEKLSDTPNPEDWQSEGKSSNFRTNGSSNTAENKDENEENVKISYLAGPDNETKIYKTVESKKLEFDNIALNVHIDTSPIVFELKTSQIDSIQSKIEILEDIVNCLTISNDIKNSGEHEKFRILTEADDDNVVKEFLEIETYSESSSKFTQDEINKRFTFSLWLQWTVTKLGLNLEGKLADDEKKKITVELEDFIISLDQQIDYTKIKSKLGTFSIRYFHINDYYQEIKLDDGIKFNMQTQNSDSPFIDITVTVADAKSVLKKTGTKKKVDTQNNLCEIIISMRPFEISLDLEKVYEFLTICPQIEKVEERFYRSRPFRKSTGIISKEEKQNFFVELIGSQLPLVYFNLGGFTIYIPLETNSLPKCNVLILNVNEILLTPNVKNPLTRKPLRPDLYNKAAQMGLLNVRGSLVEDRQYELSFRNISMASSNWSDLLKYKKEHESNLRNTNPAFDWNHPNLEKISLELHDIFNSFVITITYAPLIAYQNILVCGQSIEINCLTDLKAEITNDHLKLFSNINCVIEDIGTALNNTRNHKYSIKRNSLDLQYMENIRKRSTLDIDIDAKPTKSSLAIPDSAELHRPAETDSGISTYEKPKRLQLIRKQSSKLTQIDEKNKKIPFEISFLAGVFKVKLFCTSMKNRSGNIYIPLLKFTINQPSMLICQNIYDKYYQFSLYDFGILLIKASVVKEMAERSHPIKIFHTLPGKVNISGIPPSFLSIKIHFNKMNKSEVICQLMKPMQICIHDKLIEKLTHIYTILYIATMRPNRNKRMSEDKEIYHGSKMKIIKRNFANIDSITIKLDQLMIKLEEKLKYQILCVFDKLQFDSFFNTRPAKLDAKWNLDTFYIKTENRICLHPCSMNSMIIIKEEKWSRLPIVNLNLNINVLQIDVGVENLRHFINANNTLQQTSLHVKNILNEFEIQLKDIIEKSDSNVLHCFGKCDQLSEFELPKIEMEDVKFKKSKEEFYQDDLRAGAFQFIETNDDSSLPLPYQIHIVTKHHGTICWRYPQPRKVTKIVINPIPMPISNPCEIKCEIECISESKRKFISFCEFMLSETKTFEIQLPKRNITSTVWRVKILQPLVSINQEYFDTSEEDDEVKMIKLEDFDVENENNFILHPKVLVGCMKIDTCFNEDYIPKIELGLDIAVFELNLQNQELQTEESIEIDYDLNLSKEYSAVETFLKLHLKNTSIVGKFFDENNYSFESELNASVKILDYGFSNMQYLIEETNLWNHFEMKNDLLLLNLLLDTMKFNINPGYLHTLVVSAYQWDEKIASLNELVRPIIGRFVVANVSQNYMLFGQTHTNEKILIGPNSSIMYSFLSEKEQSTITFYNPHDNGKISQPVRIKTENSIQYIKIESTVYIIETKKLSTSQICIFIKGQIEILLMVDEKFIIQFRKQQRNGFFSSISQELPLNESYPKTFSIDVNKEHHHAIRVKLDTNQHTFWSGDIPLKPNKQLPWLVKVPTNGTNEFTSFWFRILYEEISEFKTEKKTPLRILILIWPVFELKSMFPKKVSFTESLTKQHYEIKGRGHVTNLKVPATHETEHVITFDEQFDSNHGEDRRTCNLSLKSIDWNQFFNYDEKKWTIDTSLKELRKKSKINWPFKDEHEIRTRRKCNLNIIPTIPLYRILPSREFSCTLQLELSPWCIFINCLSHSVKIYQDVTKESEFIEVASNEISRLFKIELGFLMEVQYSLGWIPTFPVYFDLPGGNKQKKLKEHYIVKENDRVPIKFYGSIMHKALLESVIENGRRILMLKPKCVLVNYSDMTLYYIPISIKYNHKIKRSDLGQFAVDHSIALHKTNKNSKTPTGLALNAFYNFSKKSSLKQVKESYYFCIALHLTESYNNVSIPLDINKCFNRKCFSLQRNNESFSFSISCLEHEGQYYINIFSDNFPMLDIYNFTNLNFFIAQSDSNEDSTDIIVQSEYETYNFEWHYVIQSESKLYYTPPDAYINFPDNENVIPNIVLAISNEETSSEKNIRWSKPIRADASCEKFLNIPMFGDVKIFVCDKHRVTKVFISYIAEQLEFCVKDLRSRLEDSPEKLSNKKLSTSETNDSVSSLPDASTDINSSAKISTNYEKCNHDDTTNITSNIKLHLMIKELVIFISKVDSTDEPKLVKSEMLAIYLDDLITEYDHIKNTIKLMISNFQIDNQQYSSCKYDFPVLISSEEPFHKSNFFPSVHSLDDEFANHSKKNVLLKVGLQFRNEDGILDLKSVYCKIGPVRAYIEDTYLNDMMEFLNECSIENLIYLQAKFKKIDKVQLPKEYSLVPCQVRNKAAYLAQPIRLEAFRIEPISVMFSVHTCIRFYIALDHSPLVLAGFERRNIITLPPRLGYVVGMHYLSGALFGAGWVIGSLEILGSPSGLARCVTTGFRDFVTLPLAGFFRGPWGFITGITQGSVSLLRNLTAGTVNSVTKLASSVARNIDRLTFDEEHFQRTELIRRTRPQGFADGLSQGLTSLGINILGAVGGLARHPLEAQNPVQVVTGVGKGIVGAITKPISGAAELVALTGHGVLNTVGFNTQPQQRNETNIKYTLQHSPANGKIWKLLPKVLQGDQILFFHEATLVLENDLKPVTICMTSTVLAILEFDRYELSFILPVERVMASFDENDPTLINVNIKPKDELMNEIMNKQFAKRRIMDFLKSSSKSAVEQYMSVDSLEDLLVAEKLGSKSDWSFYICENLGHHFLQYLKILTSSSTKDTAK